MVWKLLPLPVNQYKKYSSGKSLKNTQFAHFNSVVIISCTADGLVRSPNASERVPLCTLLVDMTLKEEGFSGTA